VAAARSVWESALESAREFAGVELSDERATLDALGVELEARRLELEHREDALGVRAEHLEDSVRRAVEDAQASRLRAIELESSVERRDAELSGLRAALAAQLENAELVRSRFDAERAAWEQARKQVEERAGALVRQMSSELSEARRAHERLEQDLSDQRAARESARFALQLEEQKSEAQQAVHDRKEAEWETERRAAVARQDALLERVAAAEQTAAALREQLYAKNVEHSSMLRALVAAREQGSVDPRKRSLRLKGRPR
jgi:chromosome segregation ATPase